MDTFTSFKRHFRLFVIALLIAAFFINDGSGEETNQTQLESAAETILLDATGSTSSSAMSNETMETEPEWVQEAVPEEIENAIHGLDLFHLDFSMTGNVLVIVILLIAITLLKPTLHFPIIRAIPESIVLIVYGLLLASFIAVFTDTTHITLTPHLFFIFLLPAIVADAGFTMEKRPFFQAFPKICLFAVVGTISASLCTAAGLWMVSGYYEFKTSFLKLLVFGSLISAVDPVSVLSTFAELDVNKRLFTLIFGESLMNDAVTIVMYRTAINIIKRMDVTHTFMSIATTVKDAGVQFSIVSFLGVAIGLLGGFASVFILKRIVGYQICTPVLQLFLPFAIYLFTESLHYSGIFACVTAAMIMSHYMKRNICVEMEFVVFTSSKLFSSTAEMVIFIFLGLSGISSQHQFDIVFCICTFVFCSVIRFINVFFLSWITNKFSEPNDRLGYNDQFIVFHSGIRGAVCFGLVQSIDDRVIDEKQYFVTTTLFMIAMTSLLQGCTIKPLMSLLKIEGNNGEEAKSGKIVNAYQKFDNTVLKPLLSSKNTYLPTDDTFRNLALPKAVSTALRIGERSHTDLQTLANQKKEQQSIPRPTGAPMNVDFALEDNVICPPTQMSTGRRTPNQRQSIYSRHFVNLRSVSPVLSYDGGDDSNYLTCPARIIKKRPTFNPYDTYNPLNTITGHFDTERLLKPRHNSIGVEKIEYKDDEPKEKKNSRTIVSGTKTFVVAPEDLDSINEESSSSANPPSPDYKSRRDSIP